MAIKILILAAANRRDRSKLSKVKEYENSTLTMYLMRKLLKMTFISNARLII